MEGIAFGKAKTNPLLKNQRIELALEMWVLTVESIPNTGVSGRYGG
jgi:hypothetical protein